METLEFLKSKTIVRNKENKVKKHTELEKNIKIVKKKEINPKFKFKIYNQIINEFAPNLNIEEGLVNNLNKKINIESQFWDIEKKRLYLKKQQNVSILKKKKDLQDS